MVNKTIRTALFLLISFGLIVFYIFSKGFILSEQQQSTLLLLLKIYLITSVYCIVAAELTSNYSQVDRLWSTIPIVYAWVMVYYGDFNARALICATLIGLWGIRLSINFALKGGFSWLPWKADEDYRWMVLRQEPPFNNKIIWFLFNVLFISLYQMGLILYFTLPVLLTINAENEALSLIDLLAGVLFVIFLLIETIADWQQYKFQKSKHQMITANQELKEPYNDGFIKYGLWKYVRHPNYMAEQMMWFCIYLFGVAASGQWVNWTLGGFILLVLLFKGSSDFSEKISSTKYPRYSDYIEITGRFFPKLFKI